MKLHYQKETEYTGIPNWWRAKESLSYSEMISERLRLGERYPSIWCRVYDGGDECSSYGIRILFNNEADEAEFILREM